MNSVPSKVPEPTPVSASFFRWCHVQTPKPWETSDCRAEKPDPWHQGKLRTKICGAPRYKENPWSHFSKLLAAQHEKIHRFCSKIWFMPKEKKPRKHSPTRLREAANWFVRNYLDRNNGPLQHRARTSTGWRSLIILRCRGICNTRSNGRDTKRHDTAQGHNNRSRSSFYVFVFPRHLQNLRHSQSSHHKLPSSIQWYDRTLA